MKSSLPDINVWLAIASVLHPHHLPAATWWAAQGLARAHFCRHTQLGLLRLLTNRRVMQSQTQGESGAWRVLDRFLAAENVSFLAEPIGIDSLLRSLTDGSQSSPNRWSDAYLASFAMAADLTLVTFDRGFRSFPNLSLELLS